VSVYTGYGGGWGYSGHSIKAVRFLCCVSVYTGYGGGWGYSGHSIEAVRFSCDSDILLGGFALFGGRGEYFGKIRVCFCFKQFLYSNANANYYCSMLSCHGLWYLLTFID